MVAMVVVVVIGAEDEADVAMDARTVETGTEIAEVQETSTQSLLPLQRLFLHIIFCKYVT
jgi:hypothetical protein